eukprot:TRINITY_DN26836_c0_g1_i1.p1 TRINITY_DN26836_c0_g1~~TRINITY_DN26836_c0_g1_i1.p1  ORF type:complete len:501 (+),score=70.93 TRINITY_DN26836_c0_g1_i1:37-1503(+)
MEKSCKDKAEHVVEGIVNNGGFKHDAVEVGESPQGLGLGVVVKQGQTLEKGMVVAVIPRGMTIRPSRIYEANDEIGKILQHSNLSDVVAIHIYLAYHKGLKSTSEWADYIASLPTKPEIPFFFTEQEVSLLHPSTAFDRLGWAIEELSGEYHSLSSMGMFSGILKGITFLDYKWAVSMCLSRMYYIDHEPVVLPFGDMFNHSPHGSEFKRDGDTYVMHSASTTRSGEEVYVTYGGGGPQAYFFHYGFVNANLSMLPSFVANEVNSAPVPWWLEYILTPKAEESLKLIDYTEESHILMQDCVPDAEDWELLVPEEFRSDIVVDVPKTIALFKVLYDFGGPEIDLNKYALNFGARDDTVLLNAPSLCALRLLYTAKSESFNWHNAVANRPIGPLSEVTAAAALISALKNRLSQVAESLTTILAQLNISPTADKSWAWTGPVPPNYAKLHQIGAVLCYETILTERLLEEAAMVPMKYLRVRTGRGNDYKWK